MEQPLALRVEHRGVSWHTYSGYADRDAEGFWSTVGKTVRGGYAQRKVCPHVSPLVSYRI